MYKTSYLWLQQQWNFNGLKIITSPDFIGIAIFYPGWEKKYNISLLCLCTPEQHKLCESEIFISMCTTWIVNACTKLCRYSIYLAWYGKSKTLPTLQKKWRSAWNWSTNIIPVDSILNTVRNSLHSLNLQCLLKNERYLKLWNRNIPRTLALQTQMHGLTPQLIIWEMCYVNVLLLERNLWRS